jgi:hypothetical protein
MVDVVAARKVTTRFTVAEQGLLVVERPLLSAPLLVLLGLGFRVMGTMAAVLLLTHFAVVAVALRQ